MMRELDDDDVELINALIESLYLWHFQQMNRKEVDCNGSRMDNCICVVCGNLRQPRGYILEDMMRWC
jgi:hypothetical protein